MNEFLKKNLIKLYKYLIYIIQYKWSVIDKTLKRHTWFYYDSDKWFFMINIKR